MVKVVKCPGCGDEISLSGLKMHVKNKHPDKYGSLNWDELKKTATENGVKRGMKKAKLEDKVVDAIVPEEKEDAEESIKVDEPVKESPKKEISFLDRIWNFIDTAEF